MTMPDLFSGSARISMHEAMEMTALSLNAYGPTHPHWFIAWSGGKDSTATLLTVLRLIELGIVPQPTSLTVLYADTRQELPPLAAAARAIVDHLERVYPWVRVVTAMASMDKRFLVYILGRGVPPPNNNTLRWCTRQIKVDPMADAIEALLEGIEGAVLTITGVRQGESAVRDRRIEMSCGKDGAECGQGWYQQVLPNSPGIRGRIATLAPLLHWRVCQVWDALVEAAADGWPTAAIAEVYGADEDQEAQTRTGCTACPLASKDVALERIVARPRWTYMAPLLRLRAVYRSLREPANRIRKAGLELRKDGTPASNPQRMGPITLEARLVALEAILAIQTECNAARGDQPAVDLLNAEEEARIRELIAAGQWPDGWEGTEPPADMPLDQVFRDGSVQPLLFGADAMA